MYSRSSFSRFFFNDANECQDVDLYFWNAFSNVSSLFLLCIFYTWRLIDSKIFWPLNKSQKKRIECFCFVTFCDILSNNAKEHDRNFYLTYLDDALKPAIAISVKQRANLVAVYRKNAIVRSVNIVCFYLSVEI